MAAHGISASENINPTTGRAASGTTSVSSGLAMASGNPVSPSSYGHMSAKTLTAAAIKWSSKEDGPAVKFTTVQAFEAAGIPLPAPRIRPGDGPAAGGGGVLEDGAAGAGQAGAGQAGAPAAAGGGGGAAPGVVAAMAVAAVLGRARSRSRAREGGGRRPGAGGHEGGEEEWRADAAGGAPVLGLRRGRAGVGGRPPAGPPQPAPAVLAAAVPPAPPAPVGGAQAPPPPLHASEDPLCTSWSTLLDTIPGGSLVSWEEDRARTLSHAYSVRRDKVWRRTAGVRVPTQAERLAAIGRAPAGYKGKGPKREEGEGEGAEEGLTEGSDSDGEASPRAGTGDVHGGTRVPIGSARMRRLLSTLVLPRSVRLAGEGALLGGSGAGGAGSKAGTMQAYQSIPKNSEEYPDPVELARASWESGALAAMRAASSAREGALGMDGGWAHVRSFASRRAKELEGRAKRLGTSVGGGGVMYHVHRKGAGPADFMAAIAAGAGGVDDKKDKEVPVPAALGLAMAGDRLPTFLEGLPESSLAGYPPHVREYVRVKLAAAGRVKAAARQAEAWVAALEGAEDGPAGAAAFAPAVLARRMAEISSLESHQGIAPEDIGTERVGGGVPGRGLTGVHPLARPVLTAPLRAMLPPSTLSPAIAWPVPGSLAATLAVNPRLAKAHAKKALKGVQSDKELPREKGHASSRSQSANPTERAGQDGRQSS